MDEDSIHHRVLKLRDVSLGLKKAVSVNSNLAPASYECTIDSLLALYNECKSASALAKDKNVIKFLTKYESTISELKKLRVTADDFETKSIIGRGHFGEVMLCEEKSTKDVFAMKIMKKAHILQQPDAAFYSAERDIMAWSSSPWLTSLHYAFQDSTSLYLVMDYHPGGDLLNIIERKEGTMTMDEARFYLAEITAGLKDLHELGFVHRDVKPENVLISRSGHIKLVDFGSAARLDTNGKVIDTQLPVGTPEYISPEVLTSLDRSADYGVCCDWWSVGIIAYELIYETTPFEGDTTSQTYNNIMNYKKSLSFPEDDVEGHSEEEARDLIKGLLRDKKSRLSCSGIQNHPFFALTDWDNLLSATPPHIPTLSGPDDVSNFDTFDPIKDDDLKYPDLPSKSTGFCGKSLPFIGFTFSSPVTTTPQDFIDSVPPTDEGDEVGAGFGELKKEVEKAKKRTEQERVKRMQLERECAVYQSQLEEFQRKLDVEKSDRRVSDARALQLLQEVKEKGKLAQQLREEQARTTEMEYTAAVEQLEQERHEASKRSQRLQEKLKEVQKERDSALKKASEYKARLTEAKESDKSEVMALQAKLAKANTEHSSKVEELRERYAEALKKRDQAEAAKKKAEMDLRKVQLGIDTNGHVLEDMSKQLSKHKSMSEELQVKLDSQLKATTRFEEHCSSLTEQLKKMDDQLEEVQSQKRELEGSKLDLKHQLEDFEKQLNDEKKSREKLSKSLEEKDKALSRLKEEVQTLGSKLEEARKSSGAESRMKTRQKAEGNLESLEKENQELRGNLSSVTVELTDKTRENKTLSDRVEAAEKKHEKDVSSLRREVKLLQDKLSESQKQSQKEASRLKEARETQRRLEEKNATLSAQLSATEAISQRTSEQLKEAGGEVTKLKLLKDNLKLTEVKLKSSQFDYESAKKELATAQQEVRSLTISRDKSAEDLSSVQKQLEAKDLKISQLQRNVGSLKEDLKEARSMALDAQKQQAHWKSIKEVVEGDLEVAESKVEEANINVEKERRSRLAAEQRASKVAQDMEEQVSAHAEELQSKNEMLAKQKELATKYSAKLTELEKERRLNLLTLKDLQKQLATEKTVSTKFYDEIQAKSRELNKLKASHMKLLKESQELSSELAQQRETLKQHQASSEKHQLEETKLQATIAQQKKLIDFLQGISEESKGQKKKKGLKFGRKGRDHAKDVAEWNKLKGLGKVVGSSSSSSLKDTSGDSASMDHTDGTLSPNSTASSDILSTGPGDGSIAGSKRTLNEVNESSGDQEEQQGQPHTFRGISKSGIRSTYTCTACKGPIKALQKLIKCSYCHVPCHAQCIDSIPNNCKVPRKKQPETRKEEIQLSPSKKPKTVTNVQPPPSLMPPPTSVFRVQPTSPPMLITVVNAPPMPAMFAPASQAPTLVRILPGLTEKNPVSVSSSSSSSKTTALSTDKAIEKASTVVTATQKAPVSSTNSKKKAASTQKSSTVSSKTNSSAETQAKSKQKTAPKQSSSASTAATASATSSKSDAAAFISSKKSVEKAPIQKDVLEVSSTQKTASTADASSSTHKPSAPRALKRPAPPVPDPEKGGPKKKSKKGDIVLLKATKTNNDYESSAGSKMIVEEAKAPSKSKNAKKRDVKLTKVTPLDTGYDKDPIVNFKEGKSKAVGFSPPDPRTSLASAQKSRAIGASSSSPAKSPEKILEQNGRLKPVKNIYTGFESSKVIKMEQTSHLRGSMMTEGWLVLTQDTLCLYDRDPRGVTRKPIHRLHLKEPAVAYVILPSVTRQNLPHVPAPSLVKAFGIQILSSKHSKELCFVASSLQSKIEWVELIQKALSEDVHQSSSRLEECKGGVSGTASSPYKHTRSRELKAVSIIPLSTTPHRSSGTEGGRQSAMSTADESGMDLSIRSSMLDGSSSSDTSFI